MAAPPGSLDEARERCGDSGHAACSVPLALYAAERMIAGGFEAILGPLCRGGGDADSIAAVAGQIAGARLGPAAPEELWARVTEAPIVERIAAAFAAAI